MSGPSDRSSANGVHEELIAAIRALRRLRREEAGLLRRIERALLGGFSGGSKSMPLPGGSSDSLPEWLDQEVDLVLSEAFDSEVELTDEGDRQEAICPEPNAEEGLASPAEPSSYLLLGSAGEWVGFPWTAVDRVDLLDDSKGAEPGPSLRSILGQPGPAEAPEPFCIRFASGAGCVTCQHVGGVVTLDEAARRGVECLLIPEVTGPDTGVRVSLRPLVEEAAAETTPHPPRPLPADSRTPRPQSRQVAPTGLVAIRYLPARVSVSRALRSRGWFLRETADIAEVPSRLRKVRYKAAFIELLDEDQPDLVPTLQAAASRGCRIVAVGSRLRGHSGNLLRELGDIPRLFYPFHESEVERILDSLRQDPIL